MVIVFISGDTLELIIGILIFRRTGLTPSAAKWDRQRYIALLKQTLPQFGVVVITSALARFDWIFIGIVLSAVKLAEYSFAYKIFELSTLPLLAIAPLLIPWFTRLFKDGARPDLAPLKFLARTEMAVAAFTVLMINICWSPMIDGLTAGKYGLVNERTIFILSLCLPLQYLCNFLWTVSFAQGRLKMILTAFVITLIVNVTGDLMLIPIYENEGAAIACLAGIAGQTIFYLYCNNVKELNKSLYYCLICTACACISIYAAKLLFSDLWLAAGGGILFYAVGLLVSGQLRRQDIVQLRAVQSL